MLDDDSISDDDDDDQLDVKNCFFHFFSFLFIFLTDSQ
jgi:hypothetical protein